MILVDTSVWIDHLRKGDERLAQYLDAAQVMAHPFVTGELALGQLGNRQRVLDALRALPQAALATDDEVLGFIERQRLHGLGIGYIDAHLLAAAHLTPDTRLWTRDRRLHAAAERLAITP